MPLPHFIADTFLDFLRKRALDESVYVRKSALQVMENIMKSGGVVSEDLIKILAEHCRDSSLMVRKLMVGSLTELVKVMSPLTPRQQLRQFPNIPYMIWYRRTQLLLTPEDGTV